MIDVALHVDDRDGRPPRDIAHVGLTLARYQVVTNHDAVPVRGEYGAHVLGAFAVCDLRRFRVDEVGVPAELGHACLERISGARRLVEENKESGLLRQVQRGHAASEFLLQLLGHVQGEFDFIVRPVLRH